MKVVARYCSRCLAPIEDDEPYVKGKGGGPICEFCARVDAANDFLQEIAGKKEQSDEQPKS